MKSIYLTILMHRLFHGKLFVSLILFTVWLSLRCKVVLAILRFYSVVYLLSVGLEKEVA